MTRHAVKRVVLVLGLLLAVGGATALAFPHIVRWIVIMQVQAITNRPVKIDTVALSLREGRLAIRGLHLADRDGTTPFANVEEFEVSLYPRALLRGHLWIRELAVRNSTVRVVRLSSSEFNLSDLVSQSGTARTKGPMLDITVDHFSLIGGTVTLEDRALPGGRKWTSQQIAIEARNVSTLHADGSATASSVTDGAPVSVAVKRLRLYPIALDATVKVQEVDLALARVYMPADAAVVLDRGRVSMTVDVALQADTGLRLDAFARFQDVVFTRPGESQPVVLAPATTVRLGAISIQDAGVRLGQLDLAGTMAVFDPRVTPAARFELGDVRVSVANLTWPLGAPARVDLRTGVPGGGQLLVTGTLQAPPTATDLRVRLTKLDLAPWARYLPPSGRISGIVEADLRVNEPIKAGVPARIRGSVAVRSPGVSDGRQKLAGAQRIEATGLEVQWPTRLTVKRLVVDQPLAMIERDRAGRFPLQALLDRTTPPISASNGSPPASPGGAGGRSASGSASALPPIKVEIGEVVVQEGALAWRDETVTPLAQLDLSRINATVKGVGWPLRGPLDVRLGLQPPRGGELRVTGRVGIQSPPTAEMRVALKGAELAPYQPYLPTQARVSGRADLDATVQFPGASERSASLQGRAALSHLDVRDGERTVARVGRAAATGLDVRWPERVSIRDLTVERPWILLERDDDGALPLGALLPSPTATPPNGAPRTNGKPRSTLPAVAIQRLTLNGGGARLVDRSVVPAFAVDLQRLTAKMDGLSTAAAANPARIELSGRLGPDAAIAMQGTIGPLGGPLRLDVNGEVREFAIPRTNPYLLRQVAWKAREGRLMATVRGRLQGDSLDARSDIRLRQLQVEKAGPNDQVQARIGLPLGLLVSLMKNTRDEITVSFPVSGRLNDPRFDFSEAIWKSARTVAINAIMAPVSWIGRLQYTSDSRIEKVQIDPIPFRPGTATITPEGDAQTVRLAGFLAQVPEVRLALTPVVTAGDVAHLSRDRPAAGDVSGLGAKRMDAVRAKLKQANVDTARLVENKVTERPEPTEGRLQVDLVEQDRAKQPDFFERLRRLGAGIVGERPGQ